MNYYQDRWCRFHHKPCKNGEPSGNNGFLFTAYAVKVGLPVYTDLLEECFRECFVKEPSAPRGLALIRSPNKPLPVISRDEILGMVALGLLTEEHLNGWNFSPFPLPKFSAIKLLKQLWELRPEFAIEFNKEAKYCFNWWLSFRHRNYFWQNNLDQLYRFAFSVPVQDRHFILKTWGKFSWRKPSHIFYAAVAFIDSKLGASGIRFLKYGGEKNKAEMVKEFPEDHPIYKKCGTDE